MERIGSSWIILNPEQNTMNIVDSFARFQDKVSFYIRICLSDHGNELVLFDFSQDN